MPDAKARPAPADPATIHVDVCPDCYEPISYHQLDPPMVCPHERDRFEPVCYVPESRALAAEAEVERWKREADDQARANMERGIELVKPLLGAMDKEGVVEVFAGSALIAEKATDRAEAAEARVRELEEALGGLANEAAKAVTEPRRFYANEDWRQQNLDASTARARRALSSPPVEGTG